MHSGVVPAWFDFETQKDEGIEAQGMSSAFRTDGNRSVWKCYEMSVGSYRSVVDDFGNLTSIEKVINPDRSW